MKHLFPVYIQLASDQIWGVRKACVEMLPFITEIVPAEVRTNELVNLYRKFANDMSKWVKTAAF